MTPLLTFTSHISGKNATVHVFPDRVEWEWPGRVTLTRALGGSMLTGSVRKGASTQMIPIRAITSVTSQKDGLRNWRVSIITSGNTIAMRVSKDEADRLKGTLLNLMAQG